MPSGMPIRRSRYSRPRAYTRERRAGSRARARSAPQTVPCSVDITERWQTELHLGGPAANLEDESAAPQCRGIFEPQALEVTRLQRRTTDGLSIESRARRKSEPRDLARRPRKGRDGFVGGSGSSPRRTSRKEALMKLAGVFAGPESRNSMIIGQKGRWLDRARAGDPTPRNAVRHDSNVPTRLARGDVRAASASVTGSGMGTSILP